MPKYFTNTFSVTNLYKKPSSKSETVTQMIYGDSFTIINRNIKWLKVKIKEDNYIGFIKNRNYVDYLKPTHKISKLNAKIYKLPNKRKKINVFTFGSKIRVVDKQSRFLKFDKGWISQSETKPLSYKESNPFKQINIFRNIKYKWGGKSFKGIDCSALVQIFLNFNNKFCPRDAKDQVNYFKKKIKLNNIKKNDIIFWKGHVAIALSKNKLIHAYGPMKKTVIMDIKQTILKIDKTANLKILGIKRI
jgi:hypothetical protein